MSCFGAPASAAAVADALAVADAGALAEALGPASAVVSGFLSQLSQPASAKTTKREAAGTRANRMAAMMQQNPLRMGFL
jgi:hypothetical protein